VKRSAFVGTNPTGELITFGFSVARTQSSSHGSLQAPHALDFVIMARAVNVSPAPIKEAGLLLFR